MKTSDVRQPDRKTIAECELLDAYSVAVIDFDPNNGKRVGGVHREWPRGPSAEFWGTATNSQNRGWSEVATYLRKLPRGDGVELLLICSYCQRPMRFLYRWAKNGHCRFRVAGGWICRKCAGLSFASEGQYDPLGWGYPRREPWNPYVFSSIEDGAEFVRRAGNG